MSELPAGHSSNGSGVDPSEPEDKPLRLGGMALRNGLLVHGPTAWAAAARNSATGEVDVASGPKPDFGGNRVAKVPLLRGPVRMAEAFAVIPIARAGLRSSRLPFEDVRVLIAAAGVTAVNAVIRSRGGKQSAAREALTGALGLLPATVALTGTELAAYHGVEHKEIAAYEQGGLDPAAVAKEHKRCGSNLIAPLLVFSAATQLITERLLDDPGTVARGVASVAGLSLAVETFAFADRNPESAIGRAVHAGGHTIQRLFATREPTAEQLEVGHAAMEAILSAEGADQPPRSAGPKSAPGARSSG